MIEWFDVNERLPEIDYSRPPYNRAVKVLAHWGNKPECVAEMRYEDNAYAKTARGQAPRFTWQGRNSPWTITHWAFFPEFEKTGA